MNTRVESSRVLQLPIILSYATIIYHEFTTEITKYMFPRPANTIKDTISFIEDSLVGIREGTNLQLIITNKLNNEFLGCSGLHNINTKSPELGIWLKKSAHGFGYGLESITALINWANTNLDYEYLVYPVDRRNKTSRKIPEHNNGIIIREEKYFNQSGFELDEIVYKIDKEKES